MGPSELRNTGSTATRRTLDGSLSCFLLLVGGLLGLVLFADQAAAAAADGVTQRTGGAGRTETAVAVSRRLFPCTTGTSEACPEQVVLARDDVPTDALLAGPLAAELAAPLLLTGRDRLPGVVREEIARTGAGAVVLLGGPAALSVTLEAEIAALGLRVDRVGGADRYETAAQVARHVAPEVLAVASGAAADPVDALVAGAWAGATGGAVLLTGDDRLPGSAAAAIRDLSPSRVVVVGGPAAVGEGVLAEIAELVEVEPERIGGPDRFATAALLAATAPALGADQSGYWLANGYSWPDIAVAAAAAAHESALLLLTAPSMLPGPAGEALSSGAPVISRVEMVGGEAALSAGVEAEVAQVLARDDGFRDFEVRAVTDRDSYELGQPVNVVGLACHTALGEYRQTVGSPLIAGLEIFDAAGLPVADTFRGRSFIDVVDTVRWDGEECKDYAEVWEQKAGPFPDDGGDYREQGSQVPPGVYRLRVDWQGYVPGVGSGGGSYPSVYSDPFLIEAPDAER